MMTRPKKSLSEMLKAEVKSGEKSLEVETVLTADTSITESAVVGVQTDSTTINESEGKLIELTAALAMAQEREKALENKVISLETELENQASFVKKLQVKLKDANQSQKDLETQKELVQKLSAELEVAQGLKTEFEEQKELITRLYSELQKTEAIQTELEEQKQLVENLYSQLQEAQANNSQVIKSVSPVIEEQALVVKKTPSQMRQSRPIGRYIASNKTSSDLSNNDIGWFD